MLISKSQHDLIGVCNQEFKDLAVFYNNYHPDGAGKLADSSVYMDPLYQYQQSTIDAQKKEIDNFKQSYNKLLSSYNDLACELDETKHISKLKETKLDELSQTLDFEVPESIKTHIRIQTSLTNVNKRLEEEILKLNAKISELNARNTRLEQQIEHFKNRDDLASKLLNNLSNQSQGSTELK